MTDVIAFQKEHHRALNANVPLVDVSVANNRSFLTLSLGKMR